MLSRIRMRARLFPPLARLHRLIRKLDRLDLVIESLGRIESRQLRQAGAATLAENEFRIYSQAGEDGILQFLVRNVAIPRRVFVEFGVENYTESNTRFLLASGDWAGLVIDGNPANIQYIRSEPSFWRWNLKAVASFITADNINRLLVESGVTGEIGLLSIDVDGNDYWIWKAIEAVSPAIVVIEYNSRFGPDRAVTIPYDPNFVRSRAHPSTIYFGASLKALDLLGRSKGYTLVGGNSFGSNAFFVRDDLVSERIQPTSVGEAFVPAGFREARDESGKRAYLEREDEERLLEELPVVTVD